MKIGQYAFVGGCSRISQDVPPYIKAVGNPIKLYGLNSVGLQRNNFPEEVVRELKRAYRLFFRSELNVTQAKERAATELKPYPGGAGAAPLPRGERTRSRRLSARVRTGVIGAGGLGIHHVRILRDMQGPDFAGFYESRADRARAGGHGARRAAHPSLESLLDEVDAVTIVVPTPGHYAVAEKVLARGIHAMIEKPIAATLEEADAMLALAREHGAIVQTGHVERFNRAIRAALPYVDAPRFIESDRLAPFNPRGSDVAVVLDLMIHDIDLVHTLVGGKASSVAAVGVPVLTPFVDIANARLTFDSGAVANITASRVSRERMRKIRIFQQSGYLSLDLAAGNGEFYRMRGDVDFAALATRADRAGAVRRAHSARGRGRRAAAARVRELPRGGARRGAGRRDRRGRARGAGGRAADRERHRAHASRRSRRNAPPGAHVREILFVAGEVSGDQHAAG